MHIHSAINVLALGDGQLGIFAKFEGCLFAENSAVEVGGALGAAFHVLAQAAQSIHPLEFINWLDVLQTFESCSL